MVTTSILLVINKVCGYLDNIRYVDIISVADKGQEFIEYYYSNEFYGQNNLGSLPGQYS